jgi:hypothetical protein
VLVFHGEFAVAARNLELIAETKPKGGSTGCGSEELPSRP